jgi:hypothetical protein
MRLSMVMIAKDERENVRPCFDTFWDHVDEVVLCDTGSRDGTIGEARRYARERREAKKLIVGRFKWCDDFGAARTYAHSLATGGIHGTIDLDERLVGAQHLRAEAARISERPKVGVLLALCSGSLASSDWQPCLLRAPVRWKYPTAEVPCDTDRGLVSGHVRYEHTRAVHRGPRDLKIALQWLKREPDDSRALMTVAATAFDNSELSTAEDALQALLARRTPPLIGDERASAFGLRAQIARDRGDLSAAQEFARRAISFSRSDALSIQRIQDGRGGSPDGSGTLNGAWQLLAQAALDQDDHAEALRCATEAAQYALSKDRIQLARSVAGVAVAALAAQGRAPIEALAAVLGTDGAKSPSPDPAEVARAAIQTGDLMAAATLLGRV